MTANKKAMEIYSKCNKVIHDNELTCAFIQTYKNDRRWIAGKQCALIAVEEIMLNLSLISTIEDWEIIESIAYYQEVKQEIEAL